MLLHRSMATVAFLVAFLVAGLAVAGEDPSAAPLPAGTKAVSSHAPYASGDCKLCHASADRAKPGPVTRPGPAMCLECHEEYAAIVDRPHRHRPVRRDCTACHNPHDAMQRRLLAKPVADVCLDCHEDLGIAVAEAKVKHAPVTKGRGCVSCHDPHGSVVAKLLLRPPLELCLSCHRDDTMKGVDGKPLQNIKAWLDANGEWHDPVKAKDCSACHAPHGGDNHRLVKEYFPREFYAPYDPRTYALCFSCHKEAAFSTPKTTLTGFRDGDRNLHYVHLQQGARGRTCRACHEVHASRQKLHVREGVPYGTGGWVLKLNFRKTATGGSCDKTCHAERFYANVAPSR